MKILHLKFFISFFIAFLFSLMVSSTHENVKQQNDIKVYHAHYNCLTTDILSVSDCSYLIGNPADFLYEYLVFFSKVIFGYDSYGLFLFLISFFIFFYVLYFVSKFSGNYFWLAIPFLVTDSRFIELGSNVLRNGLSVIVLLFIINYYIKYEFKFGFFWRMLPISAHASAFPILMVFKSRISFIFIFFVLILVVFFNFLIINFLDIFYQFLPDVLLFKLDAYGVMGGVNSSQNENLGLPLHYVSVVFIGFFLSYLVNDYKLTFMVNFSVIFLVFAYIFNQYDIGYRFLNFATPFVSIVLSYIFLVLKNAVGFFFYFSMLFVCFAYISVNFIRNFDFTVRGLF